MTLFAVTVLVLINTTLLLAGQFAALSPFIALSGILLWMYLPRRVWLSMDCWLWLVFIVLVAAQLFSVGTTIVQSNNLTILFPLRRWLPFTLYREETIIFLCSWLTVGAFYLAVPTLTRRSRDQIERLALVLAVLLAVVGLAQYYTHAIGFLWMIKYLKIFFATFGYVNNAGTWFMLAAALALHRSWRNAPLVILFAICIWLCGTRAAMAGLGLIVLAKVMGDKVKWVVIPAILIFAVCYCDYLMAQRWHEFEPNIEIVRHFPFFGVGVNGHSACGYLFARPFTRHMLTISPNAHCDPLVFCAEYGLIGILIMLTLALRAVRRIDLFSVAGIGIMAVCLHSLIDMPLRCPAVLLMILVLCGAARLSDRD